MLSDLLEHGQLQGYTTEESDSSFPQLQLITTSSSGMLGPSKPTMIHDGFLLFI